MSFFIKHNQPIGLSLNNSAYALGIYALLITSGFGLLTLTDSLWVFFSPGVSQVLWIVFLIGVTLYCARQSWPTPNLPKTSLLPLSFILTLCIAYWVLQRFENSADEYAYLFQAKTYMSGRLWNPAPPLGQALAADYTWVKGDRWAGQYPPAWPLVLGLFHALGVPYWVVCPLITLATAWLLTKLAPSPKIVVILFALSPYTLFTGASYLSHMLAAFLGLLAYSCLEKPSKPLWAVLAGFALGWVGLTRYIAAILIAMPFGLGQLLRRKWGTCLLVLLGTSPAILAILLYHKAITGDPFTPVYFLGGRTVDHLYFDAPHLIDAMTISLWRWLELIEWAGPGLVILWILGMRDKISSRSLRPEDMVFMVFVITYLAYPFYGGYRFGPRYYYEAFPFMILTLSRLEWKPFYHRLAFLSLLYSLLALPWLGVYHYQIVKERLDLNRQVESLGISNAVILVEDGPGLIRKMEPDDMARNGISADASVLFARADKVDIEGLKRAFPNRSLWIYHRIRQDGTDALSPVTN